jgi:hypothetical protein
VIARESAAGEFEVAKGEGGESLAELHGPAGVRSRVEVSRCGRWAAGVFFWMEPTVWSKAGISRPRPRHEVWVWDLRSIPGEMK